MKYKIRLSETYLNVLEHRKNCPKWGKEFCLDCFGGGLMKFSEELMNELQQEDWI
jgi:hypothetical protein